MKINTFIALSSLAALNVFAAPPYTFSAGGSIRASEINANFTYLESLVNSSGLVKPSSLTRQSGTGRTTGAPITLFSVPANAANPYVIREFHCQNASSSKCYLNVGSDSVAFDSTSSVNLQIPVAAGESVTGSVVSNGGVDMSVSIVVIYSK